MDLFIELDSVDICRKNYKKSILVLNIVKLSNKYKYCVDRFEIIFYLIVLELIYEVNLPNCKLEMMNSTE